MVGIDMYVKRVGVEEIQGRNRRGRVGGLLINLCYMNNLFNLF